MEQGFFKSLFDFSFSSFVTPKLVKFLYVLSLIVIALIYLGIAVAIFSAGGSEFNPNTGQIESKGNGGWGLAWLLIGGPIVALLYAMFYRVLYELIIVVFRIYETVRDDLALQRQLHPQAAAAVAAASGATTAGMTAYQAPPPGPPAPPAAPGPPAPPSPPEGSTPYTPPGPPGPTAPPSPGA